MSKNLSQLTSLLKVNQEFLENLSKINGPNHGKLD